MSRLTDILFIVGIAAITAGVALWWLPAALMVGGVLVCCLAVFLERGESSS